MNTYQAIKALKSLKGSPFSILSLYLSGEGKSAPSVKALMTLFHSLITQNLSPGQRKKFSPDIKRIESYLRQTYESRGKKSVVFFSAGDRLWEILDLDLSVPPICKVGNSPYLKCIEDLLDKQEKYLVLLVDREKAKVFTVLLGKIEESEEILDMMVPRNVKAKKVDYGRDDKIPRHIQDHLHRHLKLIAGRAAQFIARSNVGFIILGGHKELLLKLKDRLPYPLNKKVKGEFVTELNIPLRDLFLRSREVAARIFRNPQTSRS